MRSIIKRFLPPAPGSRPLSPGFAPPHLELGRRGEALAAAYLEQQGYRMVAANFAVPVGRNVRGALIVAELDLIAYDGRVLCFVEVKTRTSDALGRPGEAVTAAKKKLILRGANAWLKLLRRHNMKTRCDVIEIVLHEGERADIRVIEGAFRVEK